VIGFPSAAQQHIRKCLEESSGFTDLFNDNLGLSEAIAKDPDCPLAPLAQAWLKLRERLAHKEPGAKVLEDFEQWRMSAAGTAGLIAGQWSKYDVLAVGEVTGHRPHLSARILGASIIEYLAILATEPPHELEAMNSVTSTQVGARQRRRSHLR
jgi:hypothetical protein